MTSSIAWLAVEQVVPVDAAGAQRRGDERRSLGLNRNIHKHAGDRRGDRIGHQQHGLVEGGAAHHPVGHHRQEEPRRQRQQRHGKLKNAVIAKEAR